MRLSRTFKEESDSIGSLSRNCVEDGHTGGREGNEEGPAVYGPVAGVGVSQPRVLSQCTSIGGTHHRVAE